MKIETDAIHGGTSFDPSTGAAKTPIYQTVGYHFKSAEHAAGLFNLDEDGYIYSRIQNPTVEALEKRIALLEGAIGGVATSSGIAANLLALYPLMSPGDEFVASNRLYGGTLAQFGHAFKKFGWTCHFVDADDINNFGAKTNDKTRAYFCESQSNPTGQICDVESLAKLATRNGIPLIVDNTIPSPALWKPFEWGAHIVVHSTTKFLNGHGNAIGGIVLDSGTFDWNANTSKFPALTAPEPSYHNRVFLDHFKEMSYLTFCRAVGIRDLGCCQSPMNAFMTLEGMETLPLRVKMHNENAMKIATFLESHPNVDWVSYPSLPSSRYYPLAQKYMPQGAAAVFTFGVKGGFDAGVKVVERVRVFSHVVSIGETHSLISHPASTTHRQLSEIELKSAGITPDMIRLAVGLENASDLIDDLAQALG